VSFSDYDTRPEDMPAGSAAAATAAETASVAQQVAVNEFMRKWVKNLTREQAQRLFDAIPHDLLTEEQIDGAGNTSDYGADFSLADEIGLQITAVKALRQSVFPGGRLKSDATTRDAKEVLTTCNQMIKTLMDSHGKIMNMERFRAVESATLDVLADIEPELKERFLVQLESKLSEVN
jgi:hypothetical protein